MCVRSVATSLGNTAKCDTTGLPPKPMSFIYVNIHLLDFSSNSLQLTDYYHPVGVEPVVACGYLRSSGENVALLEIYCTPFKMPRMLHLEPFAGKKVFWRP